MRTAPFALLDSSVQTPRDSGTFTRSALQKHGRFCGPARCGLLRENLSTIAICCSNLRRCALMRSAYGTVETKPWSDFRASLSTLRLDERAPFPWIAGLGEAVGVEATLAYDMRVSSGHCELGDVGVARFPVAGTRFREVWSEVLRNSPGRIGIFDPLCPERKQQNRALIFPPAPIFAAQLNDPDIAHRYGVRDDGALERARRGFAVASAGFQRGGIDTRWQMRALICRGGTLLAWVGAFPVEKPTEVQRRRMQRLLPELRTRIEIELGLGRHSFLESVLAVALEELGRPAFVLARSGAVELANEAGRALLNGSPSAVRHELAEIANGRVPPHHVVRPLVAKGVQHLLVLAPVPTPADVRLARARAAWKLTARQTEALALVVKGLSNRQISAQMTCSLRTVEAHLTALMSKAGRESRAELIATFWEAL